MRGTLGTTLLLKAGHEIHEIRREGSYAVTAALLISPVLAGAMWLVNTGSPTTTLLIAIATPLALVQDVLRYVVIAEGRPHVAAMWDGVWFLGSFALLVCTWLHWRFVDVNFLIAGWGTLAFAALLGLGINSRITPAIRGFGQWLRTDWPHRLRYGIDSGLDQLAIFVMLALVAIIVNPVATAALRGATALLAPISMLTSSLPLIVIPETARRSATPQQVWRKLSRVAVPACIATLLVAVIVRVLPDSIGSLLLGNTFGLTQQIIVWIALQYAIAWWALSIMVWLKTFNRSSALLAQKITYVSVVTGCAVGAALLFKSATGIAVALVIGATLVSAVSLAWFAPWREGDHPPKQGGDAEREGPERAHPPVWQHKVIRRSRFTPRPLPDFVRLDAHAGGRFGVSSLLLAIWVFAILGVFAPLAIVGMTGPPRDLTWLGPLAIALIAAARFSWIIGVGERRLFESMFWAFTYPFMGLAPMTEIRDHKWPIIVPRSDFTLAWPGVMIVLTGTVAFLLGVLINRSLQLRSGRSRVDSRTDSTLPAESQPAGAAAEFKGFTVRNKRLLVLAALAIAFNLYYSYKVGFIQFAQRRETLKARVQLAWAVPSVAIFIVAGTYMTLLTAWVSLARFRREAKVAARLGFPQSPGTMRLNLLLLCVIGIQLANSMNPISNARYLSGTAMLAVAAALGLFATAWRFRISILGFLTALLLVFPIMDFFRYKSTQNFEKLNPLNAFVSPDYDSFANVVNGYLIAQREGIEVGRQFLGVVLFWVPRALWADKPVDTGIYLAQSRGYPVINLSAPLWVEFYFNGGFILLIVGMFALGYFLHGWDTRLDKQLSVFSMPSVLGSILPFYMFILLRGSLLQAMPYLMVTIVSWLFVRSKNKGSPRTVTPILPMPTRAKVVAPGERQSADV
jgi:hypothetical protein